MAAMMTSSRRTWAANPTVGLLTPPSAAHDLARKAAVRGAARPTPSVRGPGSRLDHATHARGLQRSDAPSCRHERNPGISGWTKVYEPENSAVAPARGAGATPSSGGFPEVGDAAHVHEVVVAVDEDPQLRPARQHELAVVDAGPVDQRQVHPTALELAQLQTPLFGHFATSCLVRHHSDRPARG